MMFKQLREIGESYGLEVVEVNDEVLEQIGMYREYFVDNSTLGDKEILVGFFEDLEKRTASFFHEIGHHVVQYPEHEVQLEGPDFKVAPELVAWMLGLREAAQREVHFSPDTLNWALGRALSYRGYR